MRRALLALVPLTLLPLACGPGEPPPNVESIKPVATTSAPVDAGAPAAPDRTAEIQKVASDAYVWGYPLVYMERTRRTMTNLQHLPLDTFSHQAKLATPQDTNALANNDVLLSSAWVQVSDEPVVLTMPDMGTRWYVLELVDMYGNPFANISKKSNGSKAATYAIVGPGDSSPLPPGATVLKAPTNSILISMRTQVDGDADVAKLLTLLKQMTLKPKSGQVPAMPPAPEARPQDVKFAGAAFYDELGDAMKSFKPPATQADALARFAKVGIGPGLTPSKTLAEKEVLALNDGQKAGEQLISDRFDKLPQRKHGWDIDNKFGKWEGDSLARAAYMRRLSDLNVAEELFSPITNTDDTDQILTGAHEYVLHFDKGQAPPAAFWTLTLYSKSGTLVDNPKKRYSVGDRTAGLKRKPDGSLDLFIQTEAPKGNESNWLPAPKTDAFVVMLRMYQPKPEATSGTWDLPAVKKIK